MYNEYTCIGILIYICFWLLAFHIIFEERSGLKNNYFCISLLMNSPNHDIYLTSTYSECLKLFNLQSNCLVLGQIMKNTSSSIPLHIDSLNTQNKFILVHKSINILSGFIWRIHESNAILRNVIRLFREWITVSQHL